MKIKFAQTIRNYDRKNLGKDLVAGLIIMAVSIPISMGYAQIAGLPAVYGLYGSVFPILLFALFSTSPQFIFGVDAAPAALIGAALLFAYRERIEGGAGGSAGADRVCGVVAFRVLRDAGGKAGQLYLGAGDGRLYHRHLHDHHPDAGAEASGGYRGDGRVL